MAESGGLGALVDRLAALTPEQRQALNRRLHAQGREGLELGPVPVQRDGRPLPASFLQQRLWLTDQLTPRSSAYVVTLAKRIQGDLDPDRLQRALDTLVTRHEILRTALVWADGAVVQQVSATTDVVMRRHDVSDVEHVQPAVDELLAAGSATGFDLGRAPLLRAMLIRVAPDCYVFALFLHHAITDGWTNGILMRDLSTHYVEDSPAPLPRLAYADAVRWQQDRLTEARLSRLREYWRDRLAGMPPVLPLPTDRPRRSGRTAPAGRLRFTLTAELGKAIEQTAGRTRTGSFAVLLAAWAAVLSRWSGATDVPIGSPYGGRAHPALEDIAGPFVNTLVLRLSVTAGITFDQLVRHAHRVAMSAQEHAELPFERVVADLAPPRSTAHNPVVQVNFGVGSFPQGEVSLPGTTVEPVVPPDGSAAKFDVALYVWGRPGWWSGNLEYATELFDEATAAGVRDGFIEMLGAGCAEPSDPVDRLPVPGLPARGAPVPADIASDPGTGSEPSRRGYLPPRDRWEWTVARLWEQLLGRARVGARDDFFQLGGQSMSAMLTLQRLHEITGRRLGLATLFENSTVERLATALRKREIREPFLVTLRPGDLRPPLVFAHGAVGDLSLYFDLVRALPGNRTALGLRADGFFQHGDPGDLSLEQMAAQYAREILAVAPDGCCHLVGFSAAGRLALAVAERLADDGYRPGSVLLLDTSPDADVQADPDLSAALVRWLPFAPPAETLTGDRDQIIDTVLRAGQRSGDLPEDLGHAQFAALCRRLELTGRALAGYRPAYRGRLTLLHQQGPTRHDLPAEWAQQAVGEVRAVPVATGSHLGFIRGPGVAEVARVIDAEVTALEADTK